MSPTTSEILSRVYTKHNASRGRHFIYGSDERITVMKGLIPQSAKRVLDLGCRDGAFASALDLRDREVVGMDIDEVALRAARQKRVLKPCLTNLWHPLPLRSGTIDLVLAGEVLEHIPFPKHLVGEMARVLRPGGRAIGSVPNSFRLKNRLLFLIGRPYERDPTHLRQFSYEMLGDLLATEFHEIEIYCAVGRFAGAWPRLLANDLIWKGEARKSTPSARLNSVG